MIADEMSNNPEKTENPENIEQSDIYCQNIEFWNRAWSPVKTAYTQMPDLPYLSNLVSTLAKKAPASVLDLGCGSGWLSILLARNGFNVTGVDVALQAINLAKDWASQESLDITFDVSDLSKLEYPESSFEACVANSIFEHFPYEVAKKIFAQLKHILAPDAVFIGCFDKVGTGPGEYYKLADDTHVYTDKGRKGMLLRCYSDDELSDLLCGAGFQIEHKETFESGTRYIVAIST